MCIFFLIIEEGHDKLLFFKVEIISEIDVVNNQLRSGLRSAYSGIRRPMIGNRRGKKWYFHYAVGIATLNASLPDFFFLCV